MTTNILDRPRIVQREQKEPQNAQFQLCYGTLPMELIRPPAVRHRDGDSERLTPFAIGIAAAICAECRAALNDLHHLQAFPAAGEQIKLEKEKHDGFHEEWHQTKQARRRGKIAGAPTLKHTYDGLFQPATYWPDKTNVAMRKAGKHAYPEARRELKQQPAPARIALSITKRQLLATAGLRITGSSFQQLDAALKRLTDPVNKVAPLLRSCQYRNGRLRLVVNGKWLDPQYLGVPLPLPLQSHAMALLLFLLSVRTVASNSKPINFAKLCDLIGIDSKTRHRQRDMKRAFKRLNDYLYRISDITADILYEHKIRLPLYYQADIDGDFVRFVARSRPTPEQRATERHRAKILEEGKGVAAEYAQLQDDIERQRQEAVRRREAFEATRRRYLQSARQGM
jgi:hypothetical protein